MAQILVIEIKYIDSETERLSSIEVSINVKNEEFSGVLNSAWIEIDELNYFLTSMDEIDIKRNGKPT